MTIAGETFRILVVHCQERQVLIGVDQRVQISRIEQILQAHGKSLVAASVDRV
jgi:hypothetical protein